VFQASGIRLQASGFEKRSCYHRDLPDPFLMMQLRHTVVALSLFAASCGSGTAPAASSEAAPAAAVTSSEVSGVVPRNAIVTLLPAGGPAAAPSGAALMDQISKQFIPAVLIVQPGQPVNFHNGEDLPHNVTVTRRTSGSEVFNVSTERGQTFTHTFDRVAQSDVKCDIHEGMEATVIVARGPMTVIAENDGRFSIPNVAVGAYTASVTYEGQTVEQAVEVKGPRTEFKLVK
jgi:plastocyanin